MREKTKKSCKTFLIVISTCILLLPFINISCDAKESSRSPGLVFGSVYYSADSLAKIYDGTNWSCINITAYCIEEYENGTIDFAVDNGSVDQGEASPDELYDEFRFEPKWKNESPDEEHIAIGECEINGSFYVFITNFSYTLAGGLWVMTGLCDHTAWELIPVPELDMYDGTWIKILIPKFKNPRKELYNNLTTNADNTIGFAVYRDGEHIGNATYSNETHYFFKDTNTTRKAHYYAVAPIAEGGYVTFGKSANVKMPVIVTLDSPNGGEDWGGNSLHLINYTISGGLPEYVVKIYNSSDGGTSWNFVDYDNRTSVGTYEYLWSAPTIDSVNCQIRISITDNKSLTDFDVSDNNFTIDSTPPQIKAYPVETAPLLTNFTIEFNEPVNKTSVENAFSYSNSITTWTCANGTVIWYGNNTVMVFDPDDNFTEKMQYNCTISKLAKDDSDPGNHLLENYTWSFVAKPGRGNFSVAVEYPPSSVYETDWCQIKVTVTNGAEPDAYNKSASLLVEFFKSSAGENFTEPFYATTIGGMYPNGFGIAYANFTFPSPGTWYLKVRITVQSPVDVINGGKSYEDVSNAIEVKPGLRPAPEKEIGPGPYVLIALMVVIAIVVALWIIASYRKGARKKRPSYRKEIKKKRFRKEIKKKRFRKEIKKKRFKKKRF